MSFGCPLDEAYGENLNSIKVKKSKKKKDKKDQLFTEKQNVDIIYPEDLKPVQQQIYQKDNLAGLHEDILSNNSQYSPYHRYNIQYTDNKNVNSKLTRSISDEDFKEFKEYQKKRNENILQRPMIEPFTNDEEFNDVLLFALTGIFFLIFTDYVYKMGKN